MKLSRFIIYPLILITTIIIYIQFFGNPFIQQKEKINETMITNIINHSITPEMSDYDKIKAIHDYIIKYTVYDIEAINADNVPDYAYTANGVFEKNRAVCRGYAEAFACIMDRLGIENKIISGYARNNTHAWNIVKLNGKWYNIDCTFDDPVDGTEKERTLIPYAENLRYDYFLIPDSQMNLDHTATTEHPPCTDETYLYAIKEPDANCEVLSSVGELPQAIADNYNNGIRKMTYYLPEYIDIESSNILATVVTLLTQHGNTVNCTYTKLTQCGEYYFTTITLS